MDTEKYKVAQQNLEKEETRYLSLRRDVDPNQLAELESTRALLKFWQRQVNSMAWNTENEQLKIRASWSER